MRLTALNAFREALRFFDEGDYRGPIGLAVSGGGDSMAMLEMARRWSGRQVPLRVATVDHRLRDSAADEISLVARYCETHDLPHDILTWHHDGVTGNLQAQARDARYDLLEDWAETHEIDVVLIGHTDDDRAETFVMNLARGSGVDGLATMEDQFRYLFCRPLLDVTRADLRAFLTENDVPWAEDPSNDDPAFQRVKTRKLMAQLAELGLTRDRIFQTSEHMRRARQTLQKAASDYAKSEMQQKGGDLIASKWLFGAGLSDTDARVIAGALQWIGNTRFRPRFKALKDAANAVAFGETRTLNGVVMTPLDGEIVRLSREPEAAMRADEPTVLPEPPRRGYVWDGRWQIERLEEKRGWLSRKPKRQQAGLTIRALGDSIKDVPDWRDVGLPRASLIATPAVFDGNTLIAAPVAGLQNGFQARIVADFQSFLLSR